MPITQSALKAIDDTLDTLQPAIDSLASRKDFDRAEAPFKVRDTWSFLQGFQAELVICRSRQEQSLLEALAEKSRTEVIPKIEDVQSSNLQISKMGQLSTKRTIEPEQALAENVIFGKLRDASIRLVASAQAVVQPATATVTILSITYTSRHGGVNKLLRPNGQTIYQRSDGQNVPTQLDQSGGQFNNAEWDTARGGDAAWEPFSQTMNTAPAVTIVCRVAAQHGNVTVTGFAGQLDGAPAVYGGTQMLANNFQIGLNQNTVNPNAPRVVNAAGQTDFTVTFVGAQAFPREIGAATLALTLTAQTSAGNVNAVANAAGQVYLTFGAPGGAVRSLAANSFTLGGNQQDVTPARLDLAILAVRLGRNAILAGGGVPKATHGVPNFDFIAATKSVDAIFLFLKSRGIQFSLGYRWVPPGGINSTGLRDALWQQPPLHTYLWMSLSPTGIAPPLGLPQTEAWAECHNLAVGFALMGELLGLTPFAINYGGGNQFGYAVDYPQPRRLDNLPYNPANPPRHGVLRQSYTRTVVDPNGLQAPQSLCFVDQNGGVNNFEGVTVFNDLRLYPLGECILAENNRALNADNYYCEYLNDPDYVDAAHAIANGFDRTRGLVPLVFAGNWIRWFLNYGIVNFNWQNGYNRDPYPIGAVPTQVFGTTPGCFMWQD